MSAGIIFLVLYVLYRIFKKSSGQDEVDAEMAKWEAQQAEKAEQAKQGLQDELDKWHEEQQTYANKSMSHEDLTNATCKELMKIFTDMGCQPQLRDETLIDMQFQGENFVVESNGIYVRIWDPQWTSIEANDPDTELLKQAVNECNYGFGATIIYSYPEGENMMVLHSRRDILLHPDFNEKRDFLIAVLNSFFQTKQDLKNCFFRLKSNVDETQDPNVPNPPFNQN